MFTGLVQKVAEVTGVRHAGASSAIELDLGELAGEVRMGDSILVDGVCLTVAANHGGQAAFDVSAETLRLSTLGGLHRGSRVNVELAMRPTDRFGGHFVSGHVDGMGTILSKAPRAGETRLRVQAPSAITDMMVMKGSVAVDGISLTIAGLEGDVFEVSLIPHTLAATTLGQKGAGARVNIECDMIGKWVRRWLQDSGPAARGAGGITLERLREEGF